MARQSVEFQTIRSEGGLLPPELRRRLLDPKEKLDGTRPEDYGLPQSERLNEAITQSWNRLRKHWFEFRGAAANLPAGEAGTGITNDKWSLPLLRELGFGLLPTSAGPVIGGRTYAINRFFGPVPIHLVGCGLSLDHRAAGVRGAAAGNPHGLVQEFLNRSGSGCLWGIVSNGLQLRVLRDNHALSRQSFLEFDLEAMFTGEVYSDFVVLWLTVHATRFASLAENRADSCWLEQWSKKADEQGTRALGDLRGGVERALQILGEGFTAHPKNTALRDALRAGQVSLASFHGQLLRVVYRLIFLFVSEDRTIDGCSLLHPRNGSAAARLARERYASHYSTARMRDMAARIKGSRHGDLWQQFNLLVGALSGQANFVAAREQLALPPLGSFLWDPVSTGALNDAELTNHDFLEALRDLAFTKQDKMLRPVDYKNLGAEELGGVYESLLALTPQISADGARFTFAEFAGNERKTSGSYYTPDSLVQCLLDSALDPVVEEAIKGKAGAEAEKAILALKICDPAVGSGHFLVGAAHRLARHLARVRALAQDESEPSPLLYQHALRDVIGRCLYGVDINPMAAELCRVGLWLEALEPGKPLSFLQHKIKSGNSLIGATPALIQKGITNEAFTALEGDENMFVAALKKANAKALKENSMLLFSGEVTWQTLARVKDGVARLEAIGDATLSDIQTKQVEFEALMQGSDYQDQKLVADAWCAAFTVLKTREAGFRLTEEEFGMIAANPGACPEATRARIKEESEAYSFFHWHLEFPDVFAVTIRPENPYLGWSGGFNAVLGNPPWDRVKLQEKEWFAQRMPEIANSSNAAMRKRMTESLRSEHPLLYEQLQQAVRKADSESHFLRNSGVYPLCGRGDINFYAVFAESMRNHINPGGRVGCVLPTGIATDDTTKFFFQDLVERQSLVSLYDFENRERTLFPSIYYRMRFCLLTYGSPFLPAAPKAQFMFLAYSVEDLNDANRRFTLSKEEIALLNPNTRTCPIFRNKRDVELCKQVRSRTPIWREQLSNGDVSPWDVSIRRVIDMNTRAQILKLRKELEAKSTIDGYQVFVCDGARFLPLFEGKMINMFNHRYADAYTVDSVQRSGRATEILNSELDNPKRLVGCRHWVNETEVLKVISNWKRRWLLTYMDVCSVTNERTVIAAIIPWSATSFSLRVLAGTTANGTDVACLLANLNSFVFDYYVRQFASGLHLSDYIMFQMPLLPPEIYSRPCRWLVSNRDSLESLCGWLLPRILELTFTAWDLMQFANDCGYKGSPFHWDEKRRFLLRCELDAAFFHIYLGSTQEWENQTVALPDTFASPRDAASYIMDTFPIVKKRDEQEHSKYRTKDTILEIYDAMAEAVRSGVPYKTELNPPPADHSVAHRAP